MKRPTLLNARMEATEWREMVDRIDGPEELLASQLDTAGIAYERQVKAVLPRKFAFDFRIGSDLLVEVQGGVFKQGRHVRGVGYTNDCVKSNLAVLAGLRCLWVTTEHVESGQALVWIEKAMKGAA